MSATKSKYARTRIKPVFTYSPREQKVRICRLIWSYKGGPVHGYGGSKGGYSAMLSLGLQNPFNTGFIRLCGYDNDVPPSRDHWRLFFFGVVLHHKKSYGGWIV